MRLSATVLALLLASCSAEPKPGRPEPREYIIEISPGVRPGRLPDSPPPRSLRDGDSVRVRLSEKCGIRRTSDGRLLAWVDGRRDKILLSRTGEDSVRPLLPDFPHPHRWPAFSPDGKRIAFVAEPEPGNEEIFVAESDGSNPVNLTGHPENDRNPAWSPDGKRIVFGSHRLGAGTFRLFVMNADGSEAHDLLGINVSPHTAAAFSPDGEQIAFTARAGDGTWQLFLAATDRQSRQPKPGFSQKPGFSGSSIRFRQITGDGIHNRYPAFSPDGRYLAYVRYYDYGKRQPADEEPADQQLLIYDTRRETHTSLLRTDIVKYDCPRPAWRTGSPSGSSSR